MSQLSTFLNSIKQQLKSLANSECSCYSKKIDKEELLNDKAELHMKLESGNLSLVEKLFMKAAVVTMETKYTVFSGIAEFWCTITSVFFAFPIYLLVDYSYFDLSPIIQVFIIFSILTAISSFVYHWTLYKLFSSADAGLATVMVMLSTFALMVKNPYTYPVESDPTLWIGGIIITCLVFIKFWEDTATTSLVMFALILPANIFCSIQLGYWKAAASGIVGILCFIVDRKGLAPTHSAWHFFGGIYLYLIALSCVSI